MESTKREDAATTTRESNGIKESEMIETLKLALEALKSVEHVGKKMDGGNPKIDEAIKEIKFALKTREYEWQGLTEEEFVYFCSYVDHDTLSQIENTLRDKNELR